MPSTSPNLKQETDDGDSNKDEGSSELALRSSSSPHDQALASRKRAQPSAASWEAHKEEICHLYLKENKRLKDVVDIMASKGFEATERMYKTRIVQWGIFKNKRREDISKMLQIRRQRAAVGKATVFYRGDRITDIDSFLRRNSLSPYDLIEPGINTQLPGNVRFMTPPPTDPEYLSSTGVVHIKELVIASFRDMLLGWHALEDPSPKSILDEYEQSGALRVIGLLRVARYLFSEQQYKEGGAISLEAFKLLRTLLENFSPLAFLHLLTDTLIFPTPGITAELWKYLAAYSSAILDKKHPATRCFGALSSFFYEHDFEFHLDFLASCITGMTSVMVELNHKPTIAMLPYHAVFRVQASPFDRRLVSCSPPAQPPKKPSPALMAKIKCDYSVESQTFRMLKLHHLVWHNGYDSSVFKLATKYKTEIEQSGHDASFLMHHCLHILARYHKGAGDDEIAMNYLERDFALQVSSKAPPFKLTGIMELLEDWYTEAGDFARAKAVKQRRRQMLREFIVHLKTGVPPTPPKSS